MKSLILLFAVSAIAAAPDDVPLKERACARQASWIWCAGAAQTHDFKRARQEFSLAATPGHVRLHVSADLRYRLQVHGRIVGYGPPHTVGNVISHDTHDLGGFAKLGVNVIAMEVQAGGGRRGGLIAQLERDGEAIAATDATWRVLASGARRADAMRFDFVRFGPGPISTDFQMECASSGGPPWRSARGGSLLALSAPPHTAQVVF
jgi:hypothetical protein